MSERSERSDPHKPLRDDVRLLGELLGDTLRTHGGNQLFDTVERVRALSKASRAGGRSEFDELSSLLAQLPVESAIPLARAFSHFLNLANVAEQHHRIRRRRAYLAKPDAQPQRRFVPGDVCAPCRGRNRARRTLRGDLQPAHRARADGASDRGVTADAHSQVQPRRGTARAARSRRPHGPGTRRGDRRAAARDRRRPGRPTKSVTSVHRRSTKSAAD